ncbi:uncharacterized protein KZ484_026295 [Pholidichthys leucotaenia]
MLCPAAVSAAAAAVWLLAVLGPGLSLPAEDSSEPDFSLCSHCFYRQTPPQGASAGLLLHPRCHRLPGEQTFATLSRSTCDTAVYSAFHLSHGWAENKGEEGEELVIEQEGIKVSAPALLRGGGDPSHSVSPTDFPFHWWDSTVTTLVQSSIAPRCNLLGGDLYILTGVGGLGAAEGGEEGCQIKPLWSAVCCTVPEGKGSFSLGLISETGEGETQVSVKELEERLGVTELFFEGCGGGGGDAAAVRVGLQNEDLTENVEKMEADAADEEMSGPAAESDTTSKEEDEVVQEIQDESVTQQVVAVDAQSKKVDAAQETSAATATSESSSDKQDKLTLSGAVWTEFSEPSGDHETADEQNTDTDSTSTLVYILSTTMSVFKAPLHPVFSTITQLPGQVTYVLQEDLGVLSALPGETYSLLHLLSSDLLSWMGSGADMLHSIGETCFSSAYYCSSSMLRALLNSCHTGVTGVGTLAGDTMGIFGDAADNTWSVTKFFGGRLWEQSKGYVGTVLSEMGGQAKAVGGGFGRLVWRSANGVWKVFRLVGGLVLGTADVVFGGVREAFGQESE